MPDFSGASFQSQEVVGFYARRPPYAPQLYPWLVDQVAKSDRLLDLGCGEGKIARPLSAVFGQVVAVDPSTNMIALGRSLKNGTSEKISWVEAKAEDAPLDGRFDLVTFASSIHWMNSDRVFAKLRSHVTADHRLAFVSGDLAHDPPWEADWQAFLNIWVPKATGLQMGSTEWTDRRDRHLGHVDVLETKTFVSDPIRQPFEHYVLSQHSRNSFSLAALKDNVDDFRRDLMALLRPHADKDRCLTYRVATNVVLARLPG